MEKKDYNELNNGVLLKIYGVLPNGPNYLVPSRPIVTRPIKRVNPVDKMRVGLQRIWLTQPIKRVYTIDAVDKKKKKKKSWLAKGFGDLPMV